MKLELIFSRQLPLVYLLKYVGWEPRFLDLVAKNEGRRRTGGGDDRMDTDDEEYMNTE